MKLPLDGGARRSLPLPSNKRGQMSFALAAVILLLVAGASAAILSSFREQDEETRCSEAYLDGLLRCAETEGVSASQEAYALAMEVAASGSSSNETVLEERFSSVWHSRLASMYPKQTGPYKVEVVSDNVNLAFLSLSAEELPQFKDPSGGASVPLNATIPSFVTVTGLVTFNVSCERGYILRKVDVDVPVYSPTPLLQNRVASFTSALKDDSGHLQNVVRYILSALVEKRALEGKDLFAPTRSAELLTSTDVENAVTLALILEQERLFRNYDRVSAHRALAEMAVTEDALTQTEGILASRCDLDPAELFLNLVGENQLDPRIVVAQSLFAAADALVLRWMDYFQIADVLEFVEGQVDRLSITVARVLGALFGVDPINEIALDWIKERMDAAGYDEQSYRYLCSGSPDSVVTLPAGRVGFTDSVGEVEYVDIGGTWQINFPAVDLFSTDVWEGFFVDYKTDTFEMAETLEEFVKSVALSVAEGMDLGRSEIKLDPADGRDFLDELILSVESCLDDASGVVAGAFERCASDSRMKDGMAIELVKFVDSRWMEIFQANTATDSALHELAFTIACTRLSDHDTMDVSFAAAQVEASLRCTEAFHAREAVLSAYRDVADDRVETFQSVFSQVNLGGAQVPFAEAVARLALGMVRTVPGAYQIVRSLCERMLSDLEIGGAIRGDEISVPIGGLGPLRLLTESGEGVEVELIPEVDLGVIRGHGMITNVTYPDEYPLDGEVYPNLHVTDLTNLTLCPYQSQFEVGYSGLVTISLSCGPCLFPLADGGTVLTSEAPFCGHFTLFTASGWPLQGVEYASTMTLMKQIGQVLQTIWDGICGALRWVWDGLNTIWNWLTDALSTLTSWAVKLIESLADILAKVVQSLKDLIGGALGSFASWLGETLTSTIGMASISFSFFGISWIIETGLVDIPYGRSRDYLKVTGNFELFGVKVSGSMRIADIHGKGTDVLFNGTVSGRDWMVQASMDPLMFIADRFLSVVATFSDFVVELSMPKVVQYDRITFSLADVPGIGELLSRIPLPIPGMTGSLDAGFELLYNSPIQDHVVINEVELNPTGPDEGREWVEVFNPTSHSVSLSGWCFETRHGIQEQCIIVDEVIPAKSTYVHLFDHLTLDNGGESGMPLGESIVLRDASGKVIDSTPFITDYYGDDRTWQRKSDGVENWVFKASTCGSPNSQTKHVNDAELILRELGDAAVRGMAKGHLNDSFSIDSLANLIRCAVNEVVETVIDEIGRAVVEVGLFVELRLQDYSQAVGGTIRLSLSVTGDFVKEGLRWVADAVRTALGSFGNPSAVSPRAHSLEELADDVWIKFGAYADVGLPGILGRVSEERFSFGGEAHINLASFVTSGNGHQNWSVAFGALFKSVPGRFLDTCLNVDADKLVDCWLLYATIHAPGYGSDSV